MASMYIHCFAFQWKPGVTDEEIDRAEAEIRAFQGHIPGLLETYAGRNDSPMGQGYTFGGVMKFANKTAYNAYVTHPSHQKLLAWLIPLISPIELDFPA